VAAVCYRSRVPAVSVLVPCFRSEPFLARALGSLLAQTLSDWEAVVVDNASDDGTWDVALAWAARDPRIRAHRNDHNLGPVGNWRRCAELATAPLSALLFSDDWYRPEFLAEATPLLADPGVGFAWSPVRITEDPAREDGPVSYGLEGPPVRPSADFLRAELRAPGRSVPVSPGCSLFRTDELRRWLAFPFPDEERYRWSEHGAGPDLSTYLQACLDHPRVARLAGPRVTFLWHASNLTRRPEVQRAYAVAAALFFERADAAARLGDRARARLAAQLEAAGEAERARQLAGRLSAIGRVLLWNERRLARRKARRVDAAGEAS